MHGSLMDLSVAGYFSMLPGVLLALNAFINPKIISKIISIYTLVMLIAVSFLGLMDMALYESWGTRLNAQIIPAFKNIGGMWASLSWWQWIVTFIVETLVVILFFYLYKKYFSPRVKLPVAYRIVILPVMILLSAVLIIPIRGGFDRSPLNHSSVYFSENLYANHAAYNYFWTFMYALLHNDEQKNPVDYMDEQTCAQVLSGLDQQNQGEFPQYIHSKMVNL